MADVPDRDELERVLGKKLARLLNAHYMRLLEELGDPPDINNVSPTFWDDAGEELTTLLRPFLENTAMTTAEAALSITSVGVDWALVNEAAADWARRYTFELVSGINGTSRDQLQRRVSGFFERPTTLAELRESIAPLFGPVRADMIATTEITRASVQGERATVAAIQAQGVRFRAVWQTSNDDRTCPICEPLDNKPADASGRWGNYDGPPAHPRCRCWINHEVIT